jgi:hypothetical protein
MYRERLWWFLLHSNHLCRLSSETWISARLFFRMLMVRTLWVICPNLCGRTNNGLPTNKWCCFHGNVVKVTLLWGNWCRGYKRIPFVCNNAAKSPRDQHRHNCAVLCTFSHGMQYAIDTDIWEQSRLHILLKRGMTAIYSLYENNFRTIGCMKLLLVGPRTRSCFLYSLWIIPTNRLFSCGQRTAHKRITFRTCVYLKMVLITLTGFK